MSTVEEARIAGLFDLVSEGFDNNDRTFAKHYEQMSIVCQSCFSPGEIRGRDVLDAGCGTGTAAVYFARNGARQVVGADLSGKSLEVGDRWRTVYGLSNLSLQKGDLLDLPFHDARFDCVFSCGATPYVRNIFAAIDEFIRVVKKDGTIVLFILKKGKLDGMYEKARRVLSACPITIAKAVAGALSLALLPVAGIFLRRKVGLKNGKPLRQTILENLFSPVPLTKVDPKEVCDYFGRKGFLTQEITGIEGVDFYSNETIFICKATGTGARS